MERCQSGEGIDHRPLPEGLPPHFQGWTGPLPAHQEAFAGCRRSLDEEPRGYGQARGRIRAPKEEVRSFGATEGGQAGRKKRAGLLRGNFQKIKKKEEEKESEGEERKAESSGHQELEVFVRDYRPRPGAPAEEKDHEKGPVTWPKRKARKEALQVPAVQVL